MKDMTRLQTVLWALVIILAVGGIIMSQSCDDGATIIHQAKPPGPHQVCTPLAMLWACSSTDTHPNQTADWVPLDLDPAWQPEGTEPMTCWCLPREEDSDEGADGKDHQDPDDEGVAI